MIKEDFNPKYFNSRNIYQSTVNGQLSHSLTDFAFTHSKLNNQILRNIYQNNKNNQAYFQAYKFDPDFEWVLGVKRVKSTDILCPFDSKHWFDYLQHVYARLLDNILPYQNTKNLLLLSGGLDSQLILAICLNHNIAFKAIHITSHNNSSETNFLIKQSKACNYDLDIINTKDFNIDKFIKIVDYYCKINPAYSFTFWTDLAFTYSLSLDQYADYDYVMSGLRAETVLAQVPEAVCDIADNSYDLDNRWGHYIKFYQTDNTTKLFKERFGNYFTWSDSYLRGISVPSRNLYSLEKTANKTMIYPYLDKQLHELALGLQNELKIKNTYKFTQFDLLRELDIDYNLQKNEIENTIDYIGMFDPSLELRQQAVIVWMKHYINITKQAGVE